jgi:hypothetical protein
MGSLFSGAVTWDGVRRAGAKSTADETWRVSKRQRS